MEFIQNTAVGQEFIFEQDGKYFLKHTQNGDTIKEILKDNAEQRSLGNGFSQSRELRKIASIPVMLDYEFTKKYGRDYHKNPRILRQILADHSYLKTCDGAV